MYIHYCYGYYYYYYTVTTITSTIFNIIALIASRTYTYSQRSRTTGMRAAMFQMFRTQGYSYIAAMSRV